MRYLKSLIFAVVLVTVMIVTGCAAKFDAGHDINELLELLPESERIQASFTDDRLPGFKGIEEKGHWKLFLNEDTAEIAVLNKRSGYIWRSNPEGRDSDTIASGVNKDLLSAQARIYYYNSFGQIGSVNTKSDALNYEQVAYQSIDNGVRVTYQFGRIERNADDLPKYLSPERYQELFDQMDASGQRAMRISYYLTKDEVYERLDSTLNGLQLVNALKAFDSIGYTEEDLARDNAEHGVETVIEEARIFGLSIEYTLDEDGLVVRIPTDSVKFPNSYPVNHINMLNFFGAGGPDEEGSLFVPDGSGALIHFNNGKFRYPAYQQDVYGRDLTMDRTEFASRDQAVRLPVFGIIREGNAFLGIIEEGASVAMINADVSGRLNSYNNVYPSFYFINKLDITLSAGQQQRSLPKFQREPMQTDYVVRYVFLDGKDASYTGMASYYRNYLAERNMLPQLQDTDDENIPFYLELVGSIERKKHFLGVPYRAQEALTTVKQAKTILEELKERDIHDIRLKYSGWFNGGVNHKTPDNIKPNRSIGGKKGIKDLIAYAEQEGIEFFPDVGLLEVQNSKGFKVSREAARRLSEDPARVYPVDMAMNRRDREREPSYVLSPRMVSGMVKGMLDDMKKLNMQSISLSDLARRLNSDYRKKVIIDRTEAEQISVEALQSIRDAGLKIMADGGNLYALPYLSDVTNAPISHSNFKIEDQSIPFYQMVIRGHIQYTGEPYNLSVYTNPRQYVLKNLEYGSGLYFTWIYGPNHLVKNTDFDYLYAVHYKEWIDLAKDLYHEVNGVLKNVHGQPIIDHQKLADGVYKTVYGNGYYVIVNYNTTSVTVDGQTIEAEGFITGGERS